MVNDVERSRLAWQRAQAEFQMALAELERQVASEGSTAGDIRQSSVLVKNSLRNFSASSVLRHSPIDASLRALSAGAG